MVLVRQELGPHHRQSHVRRVFEDVEALRHQTARFERRGAEADQAPQAWIMSGLLQPREGCQRCVRFHRPVITRVLSWLDFHLAELCFRCSRIEVVGKLSGALTEC